MYKAKREADGSYSIFGVPVFAEVPKGEKGAPFDLDRAWLQAAVDVSKVRHGEGYLAPLHFQHHDGRSENYKSGHYVLSRVGRERIGGRLQWTAYANFLKLTEGDFASIMSGHVPYRSVEIDKYEEFEIESLALLSHHTPFHKFKLLNADSVELEGGDDDTLTHELQVAGPVAFAQTGHGFAGLFCFRSPQEEGDRMKIKMVKGVPTLFDKEGEPIEFELDPSIQFAGDDDDVKLPKEKDALKKMQKAVNAALAKFDDEDEAEKKKKKDFDDDTGKPGESDDDKDKGGKMSKMFALVDGLQSQLDKSNARFDKAEAKVESKSRLIAAVEGIKKKGYHVSEATREHFSTFAHDQKALDAQVKHYLRVANPDGPEVLEEDHGSGDGTVVSQFTAHGETAHRLAVEADANFTNLVGTGNRNEPEREGFVTRALKAHGFDPVKERK